MKKLLLALALCLFATGALAQNPTCPTRPPGDSTNACASTAFVQAHGTGAGGSPGQIQYNNAGALGGFTASGDATINTTTGAVAVTATNGTAFNSGTFSQIVLGNVCNTASDFLWNSAGTWVCRTTAQISTILGLPVSITSFSAGGTSNDTTAVQAAFTACTGTSGCLISCNTGALYTVDTITVGSNVVLQGCNFKQRTQGTAILSITSSTNNVKILNNSFTGNTVTSGLLAPISGDSPIFVDTSTNVWVENNFFTKFGLYDLRSKASKYIYFNNNHDFAVAFGPRFFCTSYITVKGNFFEQTSLYSTSPVANQFATGPMLDSDVCGTNSYVDFSHNKLTDFPYSQAYEIHSGQFVNVDSNVAENVSICASANSFASYDALSRISITNNRCTASTGITLPTDSDIGIVVSGGFSGSPVPTFIVVANNTLESFNSDFLSTADGCIVVNNANIISLTGNVMSGCEANGVGLFGTITAIAASGNSIANITTFSSTSNGVLIASGSSVSGIIASNMFYSMSVNVNNVAGGSAVKFTSLNACASVTTCN